MNFGIKTAWQALVAPILGRSRQMQVAALCTRGEGETMKVLMITSRGTGRWIIPKGWPIEGKSAPAAAMQEAWEEAGVRRGEIAPEPVGHYDYDKHLDDGTSVPIEALVFRLRVERLAESYPEAAERQRRWVDPAQAAAMVDEPELREILRALPRQPPA